MQRADKSYSRNREEQVSRISRGKEFGIFEELKKRVNLQYYIKGEIRIYRQESDDKVLWAMLNSLEFI